MKNGSSTEGSPVRENIGVGTFVPVGEQVVPAAQRVEAQTSGRFPLSILRQTLAKGGYGSLRMSSSGGWSRARIDRKVPTRVHTPFSIRHQSPTRTRNIFHNSEAYLVPVLSVANLCPTHERCMPTGGRLPGHLFMYGILTASEAGRLQVVRQHTSVTKSTFYSRVRNSLWRSVPNPLPSSTHPIPLLRSSGRLKLLAIPG